MSSENKPKSNVGRLIFHTNYDKTVISADVKKRINLKETVNLCRSDDGYLTACSGWQNIIKVKTIVPYSFGIPQYLWDHIKERRPYEYDMALRFGLEFDLRQIDRDNPGFIYTEYFHTMMYLNFATYLRTNSKNNALKAIAELMSDGYKLRVAAHYKNMEDIIELTPAGWGFFNKGQYVAHAEATIVNQGPYIISQRLYQLIFGKKWNKQAYELCRSEGYQPPKSDVLIVPADWRFV